MSSLNSGNISLTNKLFSKQDIFYLGNPSMAHMPFNISLPATRISFKMFALLVSFQGHLLHQLGHVSHWYLRKCLCSNFFFKKNTMLSDCTLAGSLFLENPKIVHILIFLFVWVLCTGRPVTPKEKDILGMC